MKLKILLYMNEKFFDVVKNFSHILVDNYGVVTFANGLRMGAVEVLKELRAMGKKVIFLSNATFTDPEQRYAKKGLIKGVHYDAFVTSGQYANADIQKGTLPCGKKYVVFGTANFKKLEQKVPAIFNGSPYELVEDARDADFVYCGIPQINGEDRVTAKDFISELERLAHLGLSMVCSNPDEIASEDGRWVVRQGTIAKIYSVMGKVILYGKPDAAIFDWVLKDTPRENVLMIGDTLGTDILGANRAGIKSCLTIDGGVTEFWMKYHKIPITDENIQGFIENEHTGKPDYIVSKIF